ncbi:MAG: DUF2007 domain-containing protein [Alphaproteobacteria bacterium]|nr:DUF2007 domain-containing protein [Alphaproteobacteria bacterium]MCZ6763900.1 DUF2007 domain-containing protein [Alphaproteobacteria bacterium]
MRELVRSNDPVRLGWLRALLANQGIETVVFDSHMGILEGSASAILQRLIVPDEDYRQACRILDECGEDYDKVGASETRGPR